MEPVFDGGPEGIFGIGSDLVDRDGGVFGCGWEGGGGDAGVGIALLI